MPCIVDPPSVTQEEWLEHMLCQACRFLTREQIQAVRGLDIYQDLWGWYTSHLMLDARHYFNGKETEHATFKEDVLALSDLDYAKKQLDRCFQEADRLGLVLKVSEGRSSIENKS